MKWRTQLSSLPFQFDWRKRRPRLRWPCLEYSASSVSLFGRCIGSLSLKAFGHRCKQGYRQTPFTLRRGLGLSRAWHWYWRDDWLSSATGQLSSQKLVSHSRRSSLTLLNLDLSFYMLAFLLLLSRSSLSFLQGLFLSFAFTFLFLLVLAPILGTLSQER